MIFRLIVPLLVWAAVANAANYYVRDGGDGSAPTTSWAGAYDEISSAETAAARGDTIYVADGTYASFTCNTAESGTTVITIKKATVADHGTATGWQDTYGDGQALISTSVTISSDYWTIDGQTRNASNWQDAASYGLRMTGIIISTTINDVIFKYVDVGGTVGNTWPSVPVKAIDIAALAAPRRANLYFGYMHIHNVEFAFHSRGNDAVTIEYSHLGPDFGKECISHQYGDFWIIRRNKFIDNCAQPSNEPGTAVIGVFQYTGGGDPNDTDSDGWEIYGNVIAGTGTYQLSTDDAMVIGNVVNNWKYYHNVLAHTDGPLCGKIQLVGTGNSILNNLWYWMGDYDATWGGIVQAAGSNYSWCYYKNTKPARLGADCSSLPGANTWSGSEDPFQDEPNKDYRIKVNFTGTSPKDKATALGPPYNTDMNNVVHDNIGALATFGDGDLPGTLGVRKIGRSSKRGSRIP